MPRQRWAVLISGRGSTFEAFARAVHEDAGEQRVVAVFSDKSSARGLRRARRLGIRDFIIPNSGASNSLDYVWLTSHLRSLGVSAVFLCGFMRILPPEVLACGPRFFNIHPSLLPSYPGLRSFDRAYLAGAPLGCTIHEVVAEVDAGPVHHQVRVGAGGLGFLPSHGGPGRILADLALHAAEARALRHFARRPCGGGA